MVTILEPGFETVTNWIYSENDSNGVLSGGQNTEWKTEGTYAYLLLHSGGGVFINGEYAQIKQSINIPSNFNIIFDFRKEYSSEEAYVHYQILIDTTVVWEKLGDESGTEWLNNTLDLSAYSGVHDFVIRLYFSYSPGSGCDRHFHIDNIREGLSNVYVDINKANDTGVGTSWATAKKTMKAGWDILASTGIMHVASGDYSAQTTIAYNKSWKLSCEDPNSTGVKSVKIPKST
jgi:hypothetical protein